MWGTYMFICGQTFAYGYIAIFVEKLTVKGKLISLLY